MNQVVEFVQFNERLQNSNHYLMAQLETSILQLKQKSDSVEEIEPILENLNYGIPLLELSNEEKLRALTFNEDLDQPNLPQLGAIRTTPQNLSNTIHRVQNWLHDQITRTEDESMDTLLSYLQRSGENGSGRVFEILEQAYSSNPEVGERISGALQSWSSANVARKLVRAQHKLLLDLSHICDSKLRMLASLKQSIPG